MRILMVNTTYAQGGAAMIAQMLHHELETSDVYETLFAYGRGPKKQGPEIVRFAFQPEVYLHVLLTRVMGIQGYGTWISTRRLLRLIGEWKPDLIHFHNLHGYYLDLSIAKAVGKLSIPVVWTLHDGWPLTGRCTYSFKCEQWKTGCSHCHDLFRYPKTFFDTSAFMWKKKKAAFTHEWNPIIVCPSQWLADKVKESYLNNYRVEIIPNGIDIETFKPSEQTEAQKKLGIRGGKGVILFVAADLRDERKGASYFFEALQYVKTHKWLVLTLGKSMDLQRKLPENVCVKQLGYVSDRNELAKVYSAADVFCIPSLDDNFPTTVLESMACGTPAVGFRVGGIPEQIKNDCGILVDPKDIQGLGKAIETLLRDDDLRERMGRASRDRATSEYSIKKFLNRYVKLYDEAIKGT